MIDTLKYYLLTMFEKGYLVAGVFLAIFRGLFTKYLFSDWEYFGFLFSLIVLDTLFAMLGVWRNQGWKALSFKASHNFAIKLFLYFGVLVLSHIFGNFTVHGKPNILFTWIDTFIFSYLIAKEGLSLAKNINAVMPGYVPQFVITRLNKFQKSGRFADLVKDVEEDTKTTNQ